MHVLLPALRASVLLARSLLPRDPQHPARASAARTSAVPGRRQHSRQARLAPSGHLLWIRWARWCLDTTTTVGMAVQGHCYSGAPRRARTPLLTQLPSIHQPQNTARTPEPILRPVP
ncbi:hypothetical protein CALCODRAFT_304790 [Calocera cornea HHB12733]|uniref:Secreted protein n=1 Tax=Calocera cornea HHB12733 TaxID=1353952 RepID=A0A165JLA4_9BASI|nr:hypothetical protein CALCODRAFT_304790 [Calocera cornea HHB12733]